MSLHRTSIVFMGCRVWLEPEEAPEARKAPPESIQWQAEYTANKLFRMLITASGGYDMKAYVEEKP